MLNFDLSIIKPNQYKVFYIETKIKHFIRTATMILYSGKIQKIVS